MKDLKLKTLSYPLLEFDSKVKAQTYTRRGGASKVPYDSLNLSFEVGDCEDSVKENRSVLKQDFCSMKQIEMIQTHGTNITIVNEHSPSIIENCDGLITQSTGLVLISKHADCQAALFYDPSTMTIAALHAGWRGQMNGIYTHMVKQLIDLGVQLKTLRVSISPSLGPKHAEFKDYPSLFPQTAWQYETANRYFDLWACTEDELLKCGLQKENIYLSKRCTYEEEDLFFSYRRQNQTGRHLSCIALLN